MPNQTQQVETILKLNVDYQQGIKDVGAYLAEIKKLKDEQSALNKALKDNQITEQQYGDAMAKNKTITAQLNGEMKVLTNELKKKLEADRAEQKQIDINNASYNELSKTYAQMKKRINDMDAAERQRNKAYIDQSKAVYERMKNLQAETGKMQLNVGNYQAAITQAITGNNRFAASLMNLSSGATSASGALGIVSKDAMAASQAMMTLLANPVFLAIAGIAGLGIAYHWWKDYNDGLAEASRLTTQFTGLVGQEMNGVRDSIQATADAFGKDFKETLQAADTLVAQFGISWQEAIDTINKGFAAGADINGDYLSNIKQYGPALRDAGLSAEEFVAVLQQTRSGIFSKDGLDAITKASKSLRDMSSSTAASLRAVGINADELRDKLADGSVDYAAIGETAIEGLRKGDEGSAVRKMQEALLLWYADALPLYGADGDFGKETEDAVKAFQKEKGLPVTGVYDAATEKTLMEAVCGWVEITGGSVNVRTADSKKGKILFTAHKGDTFPFVAVAPSGWYEIQTVKGQGLGLRLCSPLPMG